MTFKDNRSLFWEPESTPAQNLLAQRSALLSVNRLSYEVCLKIMRWNYIFLFTTELQYNIVPLKVVPLDNHASPETLLPLLVAVLEVYM
jgi:hypothetical protein